MLQDGLEQKQQLDNWKFIHELMTIVLNSIKKAIV